jgi:hypothetical protein
MNDVGDSYAGMPIERVDLILSQLQPEYWTPERLRGASPSDKREAIRKAFTGRGSRGVRAGKTSRPAYRAVTNPVCKTVSGDDAPPKSDIMSDLRPHRFNPRRRVNHAVEHEPQRGCGL